MKNITDSINTINESLEKIIAVMPGMVFWKDATGKYQGCNDNAAKLARLTSRTAIIGKTIHDLFDKDLADKVEIIDAHVIETKLEHVKEELGIDPNGNPAIFLTRKVPIFDEKNNVLGLVGISIDITSQKKLEADLIKAKKETESINEHLQIASSAKSEFISSVSHEFLTPMNAIMGMAQLLIMNSKDQESTAKLQEIMRAGDHLLGLITDILDFSKLESEKFELNEQPFSLNSLFHQTVNQLAPLLVRQAKNVELIPNYASDLPDYIIGDEKCLRQIIFNLGGNAIKFTEQGNIQINALLVSKTTDNVQIRFEFKDTGKGIAAEKLNAIFERFSQVDSSYSRQHGGVGLGLAITKKLIDRMKGRIGVESTEGVGSLFWCEVNFKLANTQQISIIKPDSQQITGQQPVPYAKLDHAAPSLLDKHILVIEDDPNQLNQWVINEMLHKLGGTAVNFKDAASVLTYLEHNTRPVDLILTDIGLPDMDGLTLMQKVREDNRYHACPIVAVTGFTSAIEIKRFLAAGANKVINKPISFSKLKACVEHFLNNKPAATER